MSRTRTLFSTILPSMLAGGLLFGSAFGHASAGRDDLLAFWPATGNSTGPTVAQAGSASKAPTPPTPPTPPSTPGKASPPPTPPRAPAPTAPTPPQPPTPPKAGKAGAGISVSINNGAIQIDGIRELVVAQLDAARAALRSNPQIPKDVRDKVLARLDKVRATVDKRMANLKLTDLDKLGDELEKMGEEIEQAMAGLDVDLARLGDKLKRDLGAQLGKDLARSLGQNLGNFRIDLDFDDDAHTVPVAPGPTADDDNLKDAITDLKDLALKPAQRDAITRLRADSDKSVASAKRQLDDLSAKLHTALGNPATSDADIARYVDQISAQEAAIRKARLLAWAQARRVLDDGQRAKIQDAARKKTK